MSTDEITLTTWTTWISKQPCCNYCKTKKRKRKANQEFYDLDVILFKYIQTDDSKEVLPFSMLEHHLRKHIHCRCFCLGLQSKTIGEGRKCNMNVSKPENWKLNLTMSKTLEELLQNRTEYRAKRKQIKKNTVKVIQHEYIPTEYVNNCESCGKQLERYEALVSVYIRGIYCEECVDEDDELNGTKFENLAY